MASNQFSTGHEIIPQDANRGLTIPADLANRGLELAIWIERRQGLEKYKKPVQKFPGLLKQSCINFSSNGKLAAITSHGHQKDNPGLVIWNMVTRVLSIFPEAGFQLAAPPNFFVERIPSDEQLGVSKETSPISEIIMSVTDKRYAPIGDPVSKPWDINSVALSTSGDLALIGYDDGSIGRCNIVDGRISNFRVMGRDPDGQAVRAIAIAPDNHTFAESNDAIVRVWDLRSGEEIRRLEGFNAYYNQLSFSDDGSKLLVARGMSKKGKSELLTLLDIREGKPPVVCYTDRVMNASAVAVSPDNRVLVSMENDGVVSLWDATSGEEIRQWKHTRTVVNDTIMESSLPGGAKVVYTDPMIWGLSSVAVSPDGKRILSGGGDNSMRLWTLAGHELWEYPHDSRVVKVAFHPNGHLALSGCWDGSIYVWELP